MKIKPLNYFPLLRERKHPKPLTSHYFKKTGSLLEVLEFSKSKPGFSSVMMVTLNLGNWIQTGAV